MFLTHPGIGYSNCGIGISLSDLLLSCTGKILNHRSFEVVLYPFDKISAISISEVFSRSPSF